MRVRMTNEAKPSPPGRSWTAWLRAALPAVALGVLVGVAGLVALTRPSERVLAHFTAPTGEDVLLYEGERDYGTLPFGERRHSCRSASGGTTCTSDATAFPPATATA